MLIQVYCQLAVPIYQVLDYFTILSVNTFFIAEEKLRMVSPGLTLDILLGVLCDHGYDITKPGCKGFVTYAQESELEAELLRRIIGLMNGLSTETSFLDNLSITTAKLYTTDVTSYTPLPTGNIDGQDYQLIDKVLRDNRGLLLHQAMNSKVADPPNYVPDARLADEFNTGTGNIYYCASRMLQNSF